MDLGEVPVFVLCGGLGTRLKEETEIRPKPMVPIGNIPIVLHIMKWYSRFGFRQFIMCLGYKAEVIKSYFLNYYAMSSDFSVNMKTNNITFHSNDHNIFWEVTLADTGEKTMTGGRIARAIEKYLGDSEHFAVTYGDGLCDADIGQEFEFHLSHDHIGTLLGINPVSRYGEIQLDGNVITEFKEKPKFNKNWINGGYFFFRREFQKYLSCDESCVLEEYPLSKLAQDEQLAIYKHEGFWECMDTQRDREYLNKLWDSGKAPWSV